MTTILADLVAREPLELLFYRWKSVLDASLDVAEERGGTPQEQAEFVNGAIWGVAAALTCNSGERDFDDVLMIYGAFCEKINELYPERDGGTGGAG
jgi:hypothetical protein